MSGHDGAGWVANRGERDGRREPENRMHLVQRDLIHAQPAGRYDDRLAALRRQRCTAGLTTERSLDGTIAERVLESLPPREREIVIRFYLNLQPASDIEEEFGISPEELRRIKVQARRLFRTMRAQMECLSDLGERTRDISA